MCADGLVAVVAETEDYLIRGLNGYRYGMENRGLRLDMNKTKVVIGGGATEAGAEGCGMAMWCLWWRHW